MVDNHDEYLYSFDLRGNLVEGRYQGNGSSANRLEEQYAYDATNRMVKGIRYKGTRPSSTRTLCWTTQARSKMLSLSLRAATTPTAKSWAT